MSDYDRTTTDADFGPLFARHSDPVTSQLAADELSGKVGQLHQIFIDTLHRIGSGTANEVAAASGYRTPESIRKRATELARMNRIKVTGERRCSQTGKLASVFEVV